MGLFSKVTGGGGGGGVVNKISSTVQDKLGPIIGPGGAAIAGGVTGGPKGAVDAGMKNLNENPYYNKLTDIFGGIFGKPDSSALQNAANQLDPGDKPFAPLWTSLLDPNNKRLISEYQLGSKGSAYGNILDKYRTDAFRAPDVKSPEQLILEQQAGLQQSQQLGDSAIDSARNLALGRSSLASKRGLSGAASERLAMGAGRDAARSAQGIRAAGANQLLGIQGQELANRSDMFNKLAGLEGDTEKLNLAGALTEVQSTRSKAADDYQQQMAAWAAGKQGQATILAGQNRGKK